MKLATEKVWRDVPAPDEAVANSLARDLSLPLAIARLLAGRGYADSQSAQDFLSPRLSAVGDPFALPAMDVAVTRIWRALDAGERIVVFGDYDVDGISSTALLVQTLRRLNADVHPFLPLRIDEGYGLGLDALERCLAEYHPGLIVTVDCGTGSVDAVVEAQQRGVDVIVTDHHQPGERCAPAVALVNPKLGADENLRALAGVGVVFKLCHAIIKRGREMGRAAANMDLRAYLDLVALGTIADIVPLVGENRILARHGLARIEDSESIGLQALKEVAGIKRRVDAYEVGFQIAPRLNAAGRLGDAQQALALLLSEDVEDSMRLAKALDASNRERRDIEAATLEEALKELEARFDPAHDMGLVVGREGWHPGVIGIVASRIAQHFHRPVVVVAVSEEGGRGSCRSIDGVDMTAVLRSCASHLTKFGGHTMAAGLELKPGQFDSFSKAFNASVSEALNGRDLRPIQRIDAWLDLDDVDDALMTALERMKPFGLGNATPVWGARAVRVVGNPRTVGNGHLKLLVTAGNQQFDAMGWGMAERTIPDGPLDMAFQVRRDVFMGREKLALNLQDFRASVE